MDSPHRDLLADAIAAAWTRFRDEHAHWLEQGASFSADLASIRGAGAPSCAAMPLHLLPPRPDAATLDRIEGYAQRVLQANQRLNLVSRKDPAAQILVNIMDSWPLVGLWAEVSRETTGEEPPLFIIDAGSGSGVPGIPLQILLEGLGERAPALLLVESRGRKAEFLERSLDLLGLDRAVVWPGRLEDPELPAWLEEEGWPAPGLLTTRGLSDVAQTQEWSRGLVREEWLSSALLVKGAPGLAREWAESARDWGRRGWRHPRVHVFRGGGREICYLEGRQTLSEAS